MRLLSLPFHCRACMHACCIACCSARDITIRSHSRRRAAPSCHPLGTHQSMKGMRCGPGTLHGRPKCLCCCSTLHARPAHTRPDLHVKVTNAVAPPARARRPPARGVVASLRTRQVLGAWGGERTPGAQQQCAARRGNLGGAPRSTRRRRECGAVIDPSGCSFSQARRSGRRAVGHRGLGPEDERFRGEGVQKQK